MSKHSLVRQQESWLEQKQLLLITFWIQFWGLQKQTTLRHINRNFKAKSKLTKPTRAQTTMDSEAPHDISKACFALFLSCCTGAHFLRVIRRGSSRSREFCALCCCFVCAQREGMPELNTWNSGLQKKYKVQKMARKTVCVCAWERAKERERKSARELRGKGWVS